MLGADEARLDRMGHEVEQRTKKPATSKNTTGIANSPSWFHVSSSNDSSSVPNPPGSTITPSDSSAIRALRSCIEPVTSSELTPVCATSEATSCSVITPTTSPPAASAVSATAPISPTRPPP